MNMTKEEQTAFLSDMSDYARLFTRKIREEEHFKDLKLTEEEVMHEVNLAFLKIAKNFKPKEGGRSLRSYCYEYGMKKALGQIQRMFRYICEQLDSIQIVEFDEEVHHQYGRYDFEPQTQLAEVLEMNDIIEQLNNIGDNTDRRIVKLLLDGYSQREIGRLIGITSQAISKRLKRLRSLFKD